MTGGPAICSLGRAAPSGGRRHRPRQGASVNDQMHAAAPSSRHSDCDAATTGTPGQGQSVVGLMIAVAVLGQTTKYWVGATPPAPSSMPAAPGPSGAGERGTQDR